MGKLNFEQLGTFIEENPSSENKINFFSLKDDGDAEYVRFMYNKATDVEAYQVHKISYDVIGQDGQPKTITKYVNCIRDYADPLDKCPLCEAHNKTMIKMYIPLYSIADDTVKMWERGQKFYGQLSSLFNEASGNLVSNIVEIERCGKAGSKDTYYETYLTETDETTLEDLPEIPKALGTFILNKSFDELTTFVQTGSFDDESTKPSTTAEPQVRRRGENVTSSSTVNKPRRRTTTGNNY